MSEKPVAPIEIPREMITEMTFYLEKCEAAYREVQRLLGLDDTTRRIAEYAKGKRDLSAFKFIISRKGRGRKLPRLTKKLKSC
jgi:hypothetical protein